MGLDQVLEHLRHLLSHERDGPLEQVHEVGQEVGVGAFQELLDIQGVILSQQWSTMSLMTAPLLL